MISPDDLRALRQDKYGNDPEADLGVDITRLEKGEPLAYVIGWIPFLGLRIYLDTRPLIPRPETEWWAELLLRHLKERFGDHSFTLLDLCAGSGAIGLAVLKAFPQAQVSFAELSPEHLSLIRKNIEKNGLDATRASLYCGDLLEALPDGSAFEVIAINPPYIPSSRKLPESVSAYEPEIALYAGTDGLDLIRRIATKAPYHLNSPGEVWMETDIDNAETAQMLIEEGGAERTELHTDQYGRPRLVVSYYP